MMHGTYNVKQKNISFYMSQIQFISLLLLVSATDNEHVCVGTHVDVPERKYDKTSRGSLL